MQEFDGRVLGAMAYLECTLATDLTDQGETVPPYRQVDVRLPNGKIMRLPYSWLRQEDTEESPEDEGPDYVPGPPKRVVRRAPRE